MKKRITIAALLATATVAMTACGDNINPGKYVKLGEYKGIEVTVAPKLEVVDSDVEAYIEEALKAQAVYEEVVGRPIQEGDKVNIDYIGKKDDVAFDGGTSPEGGYDLIIGSGKFIPGFEEGLIGANQGDKLDLNLTFPEDYNNNAELAGQPVVFSVTVNTVQEAKIPELTDELVPTLAPECKNITEYKEYVLGVMVDKAEFIYEQDVQKAAFDKVYAGLTVSDPPQKMVDAYVEKTMENADTYAYYYGLTREEFITKQLKTTVEEFEKESDTSALQAAKEELVVRAIAKKEKIEISKDEMNQFAVENMEYYGYDSQESLMEEIGEETVAYSLMNKKVFKLLGDNAVVTIQEVGAETPAETETTPAETTTQAAAEE